MRLPRRDISSRGDRDWVHGRSRVPSRCCQSRRLQISASGGRDPSGSGRGRARPVVSRATGIALHRGPRSGGYPRSENAKDQSSLLAPYLISERRTRSEEHTSELKSIKRISYAVSCLKKNTHM